MHIFFRLCVYGKYLCFDTVLVSDFFLGGPKAFFLKLTMTVILNKM